MDVREKLALLSSDALVELKEAIQLELQQRLRRHLRPGLRVKFKSRSGETVVLDVTRVNRTTVLGVEATSQPGQRPLTYKVSKALLTIADEPPRARMGSGSSRSTGFRPSSENPNAW